VTSVLVDGIGELVTNSPAVGDGLGILTDAALVVESDRVAWVGSSSSAPAADRRIDTGRRSVVPSFVDSHSHLVFAGDRADEFTARMAGARYDGGGITRTVSATRDASDDELRALLFARVAEMHAQGTGTVEIKSGYGLTVEHEARLLRLAGEVTDETTFLGAHVFPADTSPAEYLDLVTGPMLEACAPHARCRPRRGIRGGER